MATTATSGDGSVTITISKVFDKKPTAGELKPGEIGQFTNSMGQTRYIVGTISGGLSEAYDGIKSTAARVATVLKNAELSQMDRLRLEDQIEVSQLKASLIAAGVPEAERISILNQERQANYAARQEAKAQLAQKGYQTLARDASGLLSAQTVDNTVNGVYIPKTFNVSAVTNPDGTKSSTWNSLSYSGVGSQEAAANAAKFTNLTDEFMYAHGIKQRYTTTSSGAGDDEFTSKGINPQYIYDALRKGLITYTSETKTAADGSTYTVNDFKLKSGAAGTAMNDLYGQDFARQVVNILSRGTQVGDTAFVKQANGKYYLTTPSGKSFDGSESPLKFTGQYDSSGNKIFSQVSNMDTRYRKAGTASVYVQNKDTGEFTYMGSPVASYTQIEKVDNSFDFGGFVKGIALTIGASFLGQTYLAPLIGKAFGLSQGVANAVAASLAGGGLSAIQGGDLGDILSDAALAGIGQSVGDIISTAADAAGGYTNLMDDIAKNGINGYISQATSNLYSSGALAGAIDDIASSGLTQVGDAPFEGAVFNPATGTYLNPAYYDDALSVTPGLISQGDMTLPGVSPSVNTPQLDDYLAMNPGYVPPPPPPLVSAADNMVAPFEGAVYNPNTGTWLNPSYYDDVLSPNPTLINTGGATNPPPATTGGTPPTGGGLLDTITDSLTNPWVAGAVGAGAGLIGGEIIDALTPQAPEGATWTPFPNNQVDYGTGNMLGMPDWWNNLYSRGGFGAGNYLGYSIMNNQNIPMDVQSLLGMNSGQTTGSTLTP